MFVAQQPDRDLLSSVREESSFVPRAPLLPRKSAVVPSTTTSVIECVPAAVSVSCTRSS